MTDISAQSLKSKAQVTAGGLKQRARPDFVNNAMGIAQGIGDAIQQGVTAGFADEAAALGGATGTYIVRAARGQSPDFGELYDLELKKARLPGKQFRAEHPVVATTAEIFGGVVSGTPVKMAGGFLRSIVTGAEFGALAGAGFSEGDIADVAIAAGTGAALGGGTAAVLGTVVRGVAALGQRTLTKSERVAFNDLVRAFERDNIPLDDAMSRLKDWQKAGAKPEVLADLGGDNVRGLLRAAVSVPGKTRTVAGAALTARQFDQGERVFADALDALAPGQNVRTVADSLAKARSAAANPLYEAAKAAPLRARGQNHSVAELIEVLNRPSMKRAVARSISIAKDAGKSLPALTDAKGNVVQVPDVELLDWIKRSGLDSIIEGYRDTTTGRLNMKDPKVRGLLELKNTFLDIVDDLAPDYAKARQAHAGPSELLDALDRGRRFLADFRREPFMGEEAFKRLTDGEREFFRVGLAQSIQDIIEKSPDGADAVKKIFGSSRLREAVRLAMPNEAALQRFEVAVERESNMFRTGRIAGLASGSPTARITEEVLDMTADIGIRPGAVLKALAGEPRELVAGLLAKMGTSGKAALKADVADAVGQILMAGDSDEIARLLVRLEHLSGAKAATGAAETAAAKGAGVGVGAYIGEGE